MRRRRIDELAAASERVAADLNRSNLSRAQTPSVIANARGDLLTSAEAPPPLTMATRGMTASPADRPARAGSATMIVCESAVQNIPPPGAAAAAAARALPLEALDQKPWLFPNCDVEAMRDPYLRRYGLHRNNTHLMSHVLRSQMSRRNFSQRDDVNFDYQGYNKFL
jgi:hypothetical protein